MSPNEAFQTLNVLLGRQELTLRVAEFNALNQAMTVLQKFISEASPATPEPELQTPMP